MSYYQDYRPKSLVDMLGNRSVLKKLNDFVSNPSRPHAYLFSGGYGCGKTTAALAFAREISADVIEMNTSDARGIDMVRGIIESLKYAPFNSRVWILDEAHGLTNDAANSLLKVLENVVPWAYFILCTTEPQKINKAIENRCQHMVFKTLSEKFSYRLIESVCKAEDFELEDEVFDALIDAGEGCPRTLLVVLEMIAGLEVKDQMKLIADARIQFSEEDAEVIELLRALTSGKSWEPIADILKSLQSQGKDPENLRQAITAYMSTVMLNEVDPKKVHDISDRMRPLVEIPAFSGFPGFVFQCYKSHVSRGLPF